MKRLITLFVLVVCLVIATSALCESGHVQIVSSKLANVRAKPDSSSTVVARAQPDAVYEYTKIVDGWYKIVLDDGTTGYISGKLVKVTDSDTTSSSNSSASEANPLSVIEIHGKAVTAKFGCTNEELAEALSVTGDSNIANILKLNRGTSGSEQKLYLMSGGDFTICGAKGTKLAALYSTNKLLKGMIVEISGDSKSTTKGDTIKKKFTKLYGKPTEDIGEYNSKLTITASGMYKTVGYSCTYKWDCGDGVKISMKTLLNNDKKAVAKNADIEVTIERKL